MTAQKSNMEHQRHELLSEIERYTTHVLSDHSIDPDVAVQAGAAVADYLAEQWGGQLINIPKDYHWKLAKRDVEIYEAFTGHNYAELARTYNMTQRGIYKVISRARKRDIARRQPRLI